MARIRNIRPDFFLDETIAKVSISERLLLLGLYTQMDKNGMVPWRSQVFKGQIFPYDKRISVRMVDAWIQNLISHNILTTKNEGGRVLIMRPNFAEEQCLSFKEKSKPSVYGLEADYNSNKSKIMLTGDSTGTVPGQYRDSTGTVPEPHDIGHMTYDTGHMTQELVSKAARTSKMKAEILKPDEKKETAKAVLPAVASDQNTSGSKTSEAIAFFCEKFKAKHGTNPTITGADIGLIKALLGGKAGSNGLSLNRLKVLIEGYFEMPNGYYAKARHPLKLFVADLNQITVFCDTSQYITNKEARGKESDAKNAKVLGNLLERLRS